MTDMTIEKLLVTSPFSQEIPSTPKLRAQAFMHEMATGAMYGYWSHLLNINFVGDGFHWASADGTQLLRYIDHKWGEHTPQPELLKLMEYLADEGQNSDGRLFRITSKALDLVIETPPVPVFISYRNRESAAFALLLYQSIKQAGSEPFLDLAGLRGGDEWHQKLRTQVNKSEYVLCILGPSTLDSEVVCEEIQLAADAKRLIIPIFHNGFTDEHVRALKAKGHKVATILESKQGMRVLEENTSGYNSVVLRVLNALGINS